MVLASLPGLAQISAAQAQVIAVQHKVAGDRIRVVVHFDQPVQFVEGTAADPYRIFFDLQGTRPAAALASKTHVGDPILRRIRVAQYQPGITRVVLDVDRPAPYSASLLADPPRLVVEISRTAALAQTRVVAAPSSGAAIKPVGSLALTPTSPPTEGKPSSSVVTLPATPVAQRQVPTGSVASFDSKLVSRFETGISGDSSALLKAARAGNPTAQFELANLYTTGRGVERDAAAAATWYRAAALQGNAVAASNLGVLYANGWGAAKDDAEAVRWFRKAAEQGDGAGQTNLGAMYLTDRGVSQSDIEGAKWLRAAAERGVPEAEYALGTLFANGRGVPRNDVEAAKWLQRSADQGYAFAQCALGKLYVAGLGVPREYHQAMKLFQQANIPEAWHQIGRLYQQGLGVPRNDSEAMVWFLKAASHRLPDAQYAVGEAYRQRDPIEAYCWFALAASNGYERGVIAMNSLAPRMTAAQLQEAQNRALSRAARLAN